MFYHESCILYRASCIVYHAARENGYSYAVKIRAKVVIVACGSISSPTLLLKSRVDNTSIGNGLRLHPVATLTGEFTEEIDPWKGTMQTVFSDHLADLDNGYGVLYETAPLHPGLFALYAPWESGRQFKELMKRYRYMSGIAVILRDKFGGKVKINHQGRAEITYQLSKYDIKHIRQGLIGAAKILEAAGAKKVFSSQIKMVKYDPRKEGIQNFIDEMDNVGYASNQMIYFSLHQMGTCRMGNNPRTSVIDENNEVHNIRNLFVTDASAFPTASGVNPLITIMAIAHRAAQYIKTRC